MNTTSKTCESRYKISRESAGLTQQAAVELLHVSERSLSDYENGRTRVPDDVVAAMAEAYRSPLLAWWHLKTTSVLGKYLPDIVMPQTNGDMMFQLVLARDELDDSARIMKKIMAEGELSRDDYPAFEENIKIIKRVSGKLVSVVTYAEQTVAVA